MDSERKVRVLREKILELTELFEDSFEEVIRSKRNGRNQDIDFSILNTGVEGFGNEKFYERIASYGIDVNNSTELKEMARSLKNVEKLLEMKLKDIRKTRNKEDFEEIAYEIQSALGNSTMMQRLPQEELKRRLENLKYDPSISRKTYIEKLKNEITQLQYERDAARGMVIVNNNPDLRSVFDDLLHKDSILKDEIEYRESQMEVTQSYNALCGAYKTLERIRSEYDRTDLSEKQRKFLEKELENVIPIMYMNVSLETLEKLFPKNGDFKLKSADVLKVLKEEIQDLAFEKNALNGIVDLDVVRKDFCDIMKVDAFSRMEKFKSIKDLQALRTSENASNSELQEFADKLELKMLMQELLEIYQKEAKLKEINDRLRELNAKPQDKLTDEEKKELQRLSKERVSIQLEINKISQKTARIRELGAALGIECISDGSLDLNSQDSIKTLGIVQVDASIKKQKDLAKERRMKLLTRYEIEGSITPEEVQKQMKKKVKDIEKNKRKRIIDLEYEEADVNSPNDNSTKNNSSVVPLTGGGSVPRDMPKNSFDDRNSIEDDVEENHEMEADEATIIQRMKVHNAQIQLDTNDDRFKQRVECGKVYRYTRGKTSEELLFVKEDLEEYLDNPKKKLKEVLDGLRDRMITELGSEDELELFCANDAENKYLKGLVSKNPFRRMKAQRDFIKNLDSLHEDQEGMAYVNMAIALNSEVLPTSIDKVLSRTAQPYVRESDMKKYVKITEKNGMFGLTHREEGRIYQSRLVETQRKSEKAKEKYKSELNVRARNDGLVRPFEITKEEMWSFSHTQHQEQTEQKKNNRRRNRSKKRDNKAQDGEIE